MARINPNEYASQDRGSGTGERGEKPREVGAGRKVMLPIGCYHDEVNGKPVVKVRSVCLLDLDGNGDEGAVLTDTFWLTSNALWRVANFALACGHAEPFDPEIAAEMEAVLASGPFETTISITQRGGKSYPNANAYRRTSEVEVDEVSGDLLLTREQRSAVENAEAAWEGLRKWLASNRRGGSSGDARTGSSGRSSGGRGSSDDEIPF